MKVFLFTILITTFSAFGAGKDRGGGTIDKIHGPSCQTLAEIESTPSDDSIAILSKVQTNLSEVLFSIHDFYNRYEEGAANREYEAYLREYLTENALEPSIILSESKKKIALSKALNLFHGVIEALHEVLQERLSHVLTNEDVVNWGIFNIKNSCIEQNKDADASTLNNQPFSNICLKQYLLKERPPVNKFSGLILHEYLRHYQHLLPSEHASYIDEHLYASIVSLLWHRVSLTYFAIPVCSELK